MSPEEIRILRALTPEQKLRAAEEMYRAALEIKAAALRARNPDWSEDAIRREVREIFMNAAGCANTGTGCCARGR